MMNENTITVQMPISRVFELVEKSERIAAVERMANSNSYFSMRDFYTVLGIKVKEDTAHEAI